MHVRRALMLLAIVLGLAAVAAALSPPREADERPDAAAPLRQPRPPAPSGRPGPLALRIDARAARPARRELPVGAHVAATIAVDRPGEVAVPQLGLLAFGEPRAPVTFDLLLAEPGNYDVRFDPLGEAPPRAVATLVAER